MGKDTDDDACKRWKPRGANWPSVGYVIAQAKAFLATHAFEPVSIEDATAMHEEARQMRAFTAFFASSEPHYHDALFELHAIERLPRPAIDALKAHLVATFGEPSGEGDGEGDGKGDGERDERELSVEPPSTDPTCPSHLIERTEWGEGSSDKGPPPPRTLH